MVTQWTITYIHLFHQQKKKSLKTEKNGVVNLEFMLLGPQKLLSIIVYNLRSFFYLDWATNISENGAFLGFLL